MTRPLQRSLKDRCAGGRGHRQVGGALAGSGGARMAAATTPTHHSNHRRPEAQPVRRQLGVS
jgi:hypothetical protein